MRATTLQTTQVTEGNEKFHLHGTKILKKHIQLKTGENTDVMTHFCLSIMRNF